MSPAKKKRPAAPTRFPPRTPAQRSAEAFKDYKPAAALTHEEAQHWARVLDDLGEYETIYAQVPRGGRLAGVKNKATSTLEQEFDKLYKANDSLRAEEVRQWKILPAPIDGMPRSTFAKHWKAAKARAGVKSQSGPRRR